MERLVSEEVLTSLIKDSRELIATVEKDFLQLTSAQLQLKPAPTSWSIIECLEHLNATGRHYLPEMTRKMDAASGKQCQAVRQYKPGRIGNYMAVSMLPVDGKLKSTMKTFGGLQPSLDAGTEAILEEFIRQQKEMIALLERARTYNLEKIKIKSLLGNILRFRLGDGFRFIVAHNIRHMVQAQKLMP